MKNNKLKNSLRKAFDEVIQEAWPDIVETIKDWTAVELSAEHGKKRLPCIKLINTEGGNDIHKVTLKNLVDEFISTQDDFMSNVEDREFYASENDRIAKAFEDQAKRLREKAKDHRNKAAQTKNKHY